MSPKVGTPRRVGGSGQLGTLALALGVYKQSV